MGIHALGRVVEPATKLVGTGAVGPHGANQGYSVSLSGDGNTAVVGGLDDNNGAGAAWVFTRSAGLWSQQSKLIGTNAIGNASQGYAVSLSGDGNTAFVGGPNDNDAVGAVWVFTRSGGVWTQQAKLVGTGILGGIAFQGGSVSPSEDGNTAIVGAEFDDNLIGAAWVFTRSAGVWSQQSKLVGTGAVGMSFQGYSVSLSGDGKIAMVGGLADDDHAGASWVYVQPVFAGTPGKANCHGQSVSALAQQYGGLNNAAAALGFDSVNALQSAIQEYCQA